MKLRLVVAASLVAASAMALPADSAESFKQNVAGQAFPVPGAKTRYTGTVGGDHPDCWGGAMIDIYRKTLVGTTTASAGGFFSVDLGGIVETDKVTFKVRKEEGPPSCKAAKATSLVGGPLGGSAETFKQNVAGQVFPSLVAGDVTFQGMVGGDHPDCWDGAIIDIFQKKLLIEVVTADADGFFNHTETIDVPMGAKITFKVRSEEGPPACKGAKATSRYLGVV